MEHKLSSWSERLTTLFQGTGGRRLLLIGGVAGIAILALSSFLPRHTETAAKSQTAEDFLEQTEKRLADLIGGIEGAGQCRVLVTLENGVEYVYATEQKINSDRQEDTGDTAKRLTQRDDSESSVIVVDTADGREGLLVTEIQPTIRGVVVVCEGGDREEVRQRVLEAVTVALNISSKRVCVTKSS